MEAINWMVEDINKLEVNQNKIGRLALGANSYVGRKGTIGEIGWSTFEESMIKTRLKYKIRLEKMDIKRLATKTYNSM